VYRVRERQLHGEISALRTSCYGQDRRKHNGSAPATDQGQQVSADSAQKYAQLDVPPVSPLPPLPSLELTSAAGDGKPLYVTRAEEGGEAVVLHQPGGQKVGEVAIESSN